MKVMVVTPYFYPHMGGVQKYVYEIGTRLQRQFGHDVTVVCSNWSREENAVRTDRIDGLTVIRLPYRFKVSSTPVNLAWKRALQQIIGSVRPDVVNAHMPVPFIADAAARASAGMRVPYVLTYHNDLTGSDLLTRVFGRCYYPLLGSQTLRLADIIVATSEYYAGRSPHLSKHRRKLRYAAPGVDLERFGGDRSDFLRRKYRLDGEKILLYVGHLDRESRHKGVHYLIRAMKTVRASMGAKLILAGRGNYIDHYRELAAGEGVLEDVIFAGFVPEDEMPLYFNSADLLVLPSCDRAEGFGMVLIEAQACGTPVIGTEIGGIPYAVEDGATGLLVPPGDAAGLAAAAIKVLGDRDLYRRMAHNGPERVRELFTWEKSAAAYDRVFREAVRRERDRHIEPEKEGVMNWRLSSS
ncbi:glycosyltransferase [Methanoculleus sediminis]|uniref:glycosyltransferase n=1 Tax=Methanoculleus sediminis TaxID=1550566 RepID=UPI00069BF8FE|nr:glycosyltransferase [Methanoculleus sediminis]